MYFVFYFCVFCVSKESSELLQLEIKKMNNELLWIIVFLVDFSALLLIYKFLGKIGLFAWIAMATVVANIQVIKVVELFGISASSTTCLRCTVRASL